MLPDQDPSTVVNVNLQEQEDKIISSLEEQLAALKVRLKEEKDKLKAPKNSHLLGKSLEEILALLPKDLHVTFYQNEDVVANLPLKFEATESGKIIASADSDGTLVDSEGKPVSIHVSAKLAVPVPTVKVRVPKEKKTRKARKQE